MLLRFSRWLVFCPSGVAGVQGAGTPFDRRRWAKPSCRVHGRHTPWSCGVKGSTKAPIVDGGGPAPAVLWGERSLPDGADPSLARTPDWRLGKRDREAPFWLGMQRGRSAPCQDAWYYHAHLAVFIKAGLGFAPRYAAYCDPLSPTPSLSPSYSIPDRRLRTSPKHNKRYFLHHEKRLLTPDYDNPIDP